MIRILVQRIEYKKGTILVGVTDPIGPDGMCLSLWVGHWPKTPYRVDGLAHQSAKICDEYVTDYCADIPGGVVLNGSIVLVRSEEEVQGVVTVDNRLFLPWCTEALDQAAEMMQHTLRLAVKRP